MFFLPLNTKSVTCQSLPVDCRLSSLGASSEILVRKTRNVRCFFVLLWLCMPDQTFFGEPVFISSKRIFLMVQCNGGTDSGKR